MIRALYTAATGMKAQQLFLDNVSNNLANINTTGFKRSQVNFQDLLYDKKYMAGSESAQGFDDHGPHATCGPRRHDRQRGLRR